MSRKRKLLFTQEEFKQLTKEYTVVEIAKQYNCKPQSIREYASKNKIPIIKAANQKYNDSRAVIIGQYRYSAKIRGLVFTLTDDEFFQIIQQPCTYCGRELTNEIGWGKRAYVSKPRTPFKFTGIDRRDNEQGYTLENSVSCCKLCNYAKSTLGTTEFFQWIDALVRFRQNS